MSKLDLTFGAKWQIAKNSDKYQKKYFFYKSIVYIMFLNAYMQISGRLIIREVRDNIMLHFMRTGRTICQCHALNIKCTLWFFPKKLWILILIQLVLSWCKLVLRLLMFIIHHYHHSELARNQNAGVTVDQHADTLKYKYTSLHVHVLLRDFWESSPSELIVGNGSCRAPQFPYAPAVRVVQLNQAHQANYRAINACSWWINKCSFFELYL